MHRSGSRLPMCAELKLATMQATPITSARAGQQLPTHCAWVVYAAKPLADAVR